MTKEQAIMYLRSMQGICSPQDRMAKEAVRMATDALSAEAVHIEVYRDLYEKYVELQHASAEADYKTHIRLINADALIFELEEWKKNPNNDDSAVDLVNHFIGIIKAEPSAEAVSRESYIKAVGYVEWLEKLIVDSETFEWLCDDTPDHEWCEKNCNYSSIQAECLRHLYEAKPSAETIQRW